MIKKFIIIFSVLTIFLGFTTNEVSAEEKLVYEHVEGYKDYIITDKIRYMNFEGLKCVYVPLIQDRNGTRYSKGYRFNK